MAQAIPIAIGLATTMLSYQAQSQAANAARKVGELNAANIEAENMEEARRLKESQRRALAEATALGAATGISGGSQDIYLSEMGEWQESELEWLKKSGLMQAQLALAQGGYQYQSGMAEANTTLYGGLGQAGIMAYETDWSKT